MEKRVIAFLIDCAIVCAIAFALAWVAAATRDSVPVVSGILSGIVILLDCVYLFKDVVGGQSIGKRMKKIKVVLKSGEDADVLRLIARNITFVIWPIEAILVVMGRERIGDKLAKTMVVEIQE